MILGIGFIATLTAAVSAYFLSNFGDKQTTLEDVLNKLEEIDKELDELREAKMSDKNLELLAEDFSKPVWNLLQHPRLCVAVKNILIK